MKNQTPFVDPKPSIKIILASLWASTMFCYIYGDYFGLYKPGTLQDMLAGNMGPLGSTTQGVLVGTSILMVIPSLMVVLSLLLKAGINRWVNMIIGLFYTFTMIITLPGAWNFYIILGIIEIGLTLSIFWYALKWPKELERS